MFPKLLRFLAALFVLTALPSAAAQPEAGTEVRDLVEKLGDDSYVVRRRAEMQLLRIGIDAFAELKKALVGEDVEVAHRAEHLLGQFEMIYLGQEDETVRDLVNLYSVEQNTAQKAAYVWALANPMPIYGYPDGEGLRTLCRIARFDPERVLRVEAAKCLIGSPPLAPSKRKKWYRALTQLFSDPGEDALFRLIQDFARLRGEVDLLKDNAERQARDDAAKGGPPLDFPVPIQPPVTLRDKVRDFTDRLAAFQADPENNTVQPGNWIDLAVFYALADLQDDLGLTAECDRTLDAARAVRTSTLQSDNPLLPIDPLAGQSFGDHYYMGLLLMERNRYRWAERHFRLVAEEGEVGLKSRACYLISGIKHLLDEVDDAIRFLDRNLEILQSEEYTTKYNNSEDKVKDATARKLYYQAQRIADAGDWKKTAELIDPILKLDPGEIDAIILRHEACRRVPELDQAYRDKMKEIIEKSIGIIERQMRENMRPQVACNQVAWLLSNTDGDYATALALINVTVKLEPESPVYLDTQAHVFALGKEYAKAVETQEKAVRLAPESQVFRAALLKFRHLAGASVPR